MHDGDIAVLWHKCDVLFLSASLNLKSNEVMEKTVRRGKERLKVLCHL
jgi:hypothetical protein